MWFDSELPTAICGYKWEKPLAVNENVKDDKIQFTYRHGDLERSLPVPGRIQNFIWALLREEVQLGNLRIVEHQLDLRATSLD